MFGKNMEDGALLEVDKDVTDEELENLKIFFDKSTVIREDDTISKEKWLRENNMLTD